MNKKEFKYIEIRKHEDDSVVERINVSHKGESQIDRIEDGINRNMNHDAFYTEVVESETELETNISLPRLKKDIKG